MTTIIEIVSVYHYRDYRPNYVLGDAWDQTEHYFTDYENFERHAYELPDGYKVAEDVSGAKHIYSTSSREVCELFRHPCGDDYRPAFWGDSKNKIVLQLATNHGNAVINK